MLQAYAELIAGTILCTVLAVFTFGKSPVFRIDRAGAAIIGAVLMMGSGVLSFDQGTRAVDWRTIVVLFSMMVIVANLKIAGFFDLLGQSVLNRIQTKRGLLFAVIAVSGVVSAIAINDIVCLLLTPVVLFICRRANCPPIPHLLGLAMASNIGSAATFLGNPQNILIGNLSKSPFFDYFLMAAPVAALGMALLYLMIGFVYKAALNGSLDCPPSREVYYHRYLIMKSLCVLGAIIGLYAFGLDIALLSSLGAAVLLMTRRIKPNKIYTSIDFNLLVIFIGLFIVVGGIEASGLLSRINALLPIEKMGELSVFAPTSIVLSNIVSNVPAVLLLQYYIPDGSLLHWQALALFSTIAGNLTIFGSIANLIVVEIAKRQKVTITAKEYFKIGCPLTILLSLIALLRLIL